MEPTSTFWQDIKVARTEIPDFNLSLYKNKDTVYNFYLDDNKRLKSVGSIQTLLELHVFMSKSLGILNPNLFFSPDFPDYLFPVDDPRYKDGVLSMDPSTNAEMPHHREDLWKRNYAEYQGAEIVPAPGVTWGVVRQEPGTLGDRPFQGTQELQPRPREFIGIFHPDTKKYIGSVVGQDFIEKYGSLLKFIKVKGQYFDNLIQYNVWARSSWEVE